MVFLTIFHPVFLQITKSVLWIRIWPDPKILAGCGSGSEKYHSESGQLRIWKEIEITLLWKTDKIWKIFNKNAQLKNINSFFKKFP
jgi:hypothetical protein